MCRQPLTSHWPWSLRPTASTVPSFRRPSVWAQPAATAMISRQCPASHWPCSFQPDATTVLSALRPTVWWLPAATATIPRHLHIALAALVGAYSHHRAVRSKPDGVEVPCRDRRNAAPAPDAALSVHVVAYGDDGAVRAQAYCVPVAGRDGHDLAPAPDVTLALVVPPDSNNCAVGS